MAAISRAAAGTEQKQPSAPRSQGREFPGQTLDRRYVDLLRDLGNCQKKLPNVVRHQQLPRRSTVGRKAHTRFCDCLQSLEPER
jgi:hypothetical protein